MIRSASLPTIGILAVLGSVAAGADAPRPSGLEAVAAIEETLVGAIAKAERSVVAIARVRKQLPGDTFQLEIRPDPFERRVVPPSVPQPTDPDFVPNEYATGVVIDRRGLILTAYHVLGEDSEYFVRTHDRKPYRARIVAADPRSDLAVLAIDAANLKPITLGDAEQLRKGQIVVALGNPYRIAQDGQASASWGIVSNLGRKAPADPGQSAGSGKPTLHHYGTLIQTDAKLNLGTSGGALINLRGEMVGLTISLAAIAGYEQAAGYAIPADPTFRRVIDTLKQGREVEYGFLGVQPANLRAEEVLGGMHGVRVDRVEPGTPAAQYGLKPDDIITAVDGRAIHDADSLVLALGRLPVEAVARLDLIRDGRRRVLNATLTKYRVRGKKIITQWPEPWRGMRVDYPSVAVDHEPGTASRQPYYEQGVVITDVMETSPAWAAGLRRGMRVLQVGRTSVGTPGEFRAAVAGNRGPVRLRLVDENSPLRVVPPAS